nr:SPOR domain-containing protein [Sphingomicrobium sediminis]
MAVGAVVVLLALGALAVTTFLLGRDSGVGGEPELIAAPSTPYKVEPEDPGGLDLSDDSGTAFATSEGEDPDAQLDTDKLEDNTPRIAVDEPQRPAATLPDNETRRPVPAEGPPPVARGSAGGPLIQLGAYSSRATAETGWALLSSQFDEVAAMDKVIQEANVNGQNLFRLRARAADADAARSACNALRAAGESCVIVN